MLYLYDFCFVFFIVGFFKYECLTVSEKKGMNNNFKNPFHSNS